LQKFKDRPDDLNPAFMFSLTATQLLTEALSGEYDINYLLRKELANRGLDRQGKWIGFDKAKKLHGIEK
jgi:hypothetical protein